VSGNVRNQVVAALAFQSVDFLAYITALNAAAANVDAAAYVASVLQTEYSALAALCTASGITGVSSMDTFCTYYNVGAGGPWAALLSPDYRTLYGIFNNDTYPTAYNVYFEVLQGATYANGLRSLAVGGAQTAGQDIDSAKYAGGFGQIKWAGATGSGTVTVTGTWRKTDGTLRTAAAGTAALSGATGTAVLTPPAANELLVLVTGIAVDAGITAGTIYAEAARPAGR
jgi:hypothetical protein